MFNHCNPYRYHISKLLTAVFLILPGMLYASSHIAHSPTKVKRMALLGDSMTWIGGDSCENPTGWSHILKNSNIAGEIDVYARSGATWTNTSNTKIDTSFYSEVLHDDNVLFNQAIRLIDDQRGIESNDPDYIILFAGANDAWFADKRPGIYAKDESIQYDSFPSDIKPNEITSLYGSVALVCDMLHLHFPESNLCVVTPLQMSKVSADKIHETSDIIEAAAKSKGCVVLRADKEVSISHEIESKSPIYTYDGVHTNPEGAKILGDFILQNLFLVSHKND
ncbi:MAG: SGNH/GDSL hydrolase family protein [Muribaculaceae bacterium]|nr:SGNH/GDSL hydrolase family protein [Muribaculaceae bacterium]